ncbi:MAG TPA: SDR family oxidoreductase [Gammaproteobacteria bacterium]|nr:SDR family oxidoreductase [Gammaproteobacteria bacterium]
MSDLTGKVAVIIGASGQHNFGSATARRMAKAGAKVVVSARRQDKIEALANELDGIAISCDISQEEQIKSLFEQARTETGQIDIAVNCAGQMAAAPISMLTKELIQPTLDISFTGTLLFFRYAAECMPQGGSVMTISSLTARLPGPALGVYSATRAGIDYAIKVAALEYGPQKIRFNSIAAGLTRTDMTDAMFQDSATEERFLPHIPLRRMGSINDVAEAALWLADEQASGFVTGQLLDLSGGQHMGHLPH